MSVGLVVGLVVVSHSRALAEAAVALAAEMLQGADVPIEVAAGVDGGFGTDATAVLDAITAADRGDGVVVLMDLGSAVLSTELALELLDDGQRDRVLLSPAPFVEGLVVAAVAAAGGADRAAVAAEALAGLAGKQEHLGDATATAPAPPVEEAGEQGSFEVRNTHGLHARPAARLVRSLSGLAATVELRNASTGSGWVAAGSLSQVATLGALQGHRIEVRSSGPAAAHALQVLQELAGRGDDAGDADGGAESVDVDEPGRAATVGASPGLAVGPARIVPVAAPVDLPTTTAGPPEQEADRLEQARERARAEIAGSRATAAGLDDAEAGAVFDAHELMLDDQPLLRDARARIAAGAPAASAWEAAVGKVEAALGALPDPYLRARAADVRAVGDAVLRAFSGAAQHPVDVDGVLVTGDLTPGQVVQLDPARTVGVVLAHGDRYGHTAILLRSRGLPAVVTAGDAVLRIADGARLALDGATGELLVAPDEQTLARLVEAQEAAAAATAAGPRASR